MSPKNKTATSDEQRVAIELRRILTCPHVLSDLDVIPGGGVMLREEGYQFTVESGPDLSRYVVTIRRETI